MNFGHRARLKLLLQSRSITAYRNERERIRDERKETVKNHLQEVLDRHNDPDRAISEFYKRVGTYDHDLVEKALRENGLRGV